MGWVGLGWVGLGWVGLGWVGRLAWVGNTHKAHANRCRNMRCVDSVFARPSEKPCERCGVAACFRVHAFHLAKGACFAWQPLTSRVSLKRPSMGLCRALVARVIHRVVATESTKRTFWTNSLQHVNLQKVERSTFCSFGGLGAAHCFKKFFGFLPFAGMNQYLFDLPLFDYLALVDICSVFSRGRNQMEGPFRT